MNRLNKPHRFPMTFASLALLAIPFGCGSEGPTTAEVPAQPSAVANTQPTGVAPAPMPEAFDQAVRQTAGELKHDARKDETDAKKEVRSAEGDVKKAVNDAEVEAKDRAKSLEDEARKAAEDALNNLLPPPK